VTHLPQSHYVSQIAGKFDGERCVIISAGPSLEKQLPLLKAIQNKIVLISVGAALPTLHAHDIHPHFVILIDPIELNINDFSTGKFTHEVLISSLVGNSSVVASFQGKKFFTQYSQAFDEAPSNPFGKMCFMDSAGSVANCAYAFAKIIGMKSIAFVGQDLAYTGGVSHALGHQQREDKTAKDMEKDAGMKKVAGYHGDTVYTTVPTVTEPTATSVFFEADLNNSGDDGDSGWVNPTAAVKTMTVTWLSQDGGSSAKLAIAVKKAALPDTGIDLTTGALAALVLGVLGAVALIATRRRNA
jgi:LPXTG-motif cell wall-anchored protein